MLLAVCAVLLPFNLITILLLIALWGGYYEFIQIGIFNYVSRHKDSDEYATSFGRIYVFEYMSYVIAPIIAGILVIQGKVPIYVLAIACVVTAMLFILPLQKLHQRREKPLLTYETKVNFNIKKEIESLKKVWQIAFVMLIAVFMYNIWLSFVWTLIPIQSTISNPIIAGLITATFTIPLATLQGIGGKTADMYGKNLTFITGFFVATVFTLLFGLQTQLIIKILDALMASTGFAFAYPAIMGETSFSSLGHKKDLGNVSGLQRIFVNAGYALGPILGGVFAHFVGLQKSFTPLGILMLLSFLVIVVCMLHFHLKGGKNRGLVMELTF